MRSMFETAQRSIEAEDRGPIILICSFSFLSFATAFFIARVYTRIWLLRSWQRDDSLLCLAWVTSLCLTAATCLTTFYGGGRHDVMLSSYEIMMNLKLSFLCSILYNTTILVTKLSICASYLRIFASDQWGRYAVMGCIGFITAFYIPNLALTIFRCHPISAAWNEGSPLPHDKCMDIIPLMYTATAVNLLSDLWIFAIVFPRVMGLNIPRRQKILTLGVVCLGWVVMGASIIRLILASDDMNKGDQTWTVFHVLVWSVIECDVAISCASATAIKPLLAKLMPHVMDSKSAFNINEKYGNHENMVYLNLGAGWTKQPAHPSSGPQLTTHLSSRSARSARMPMEEFNFELLTPAEAHKAPVSPTISEYDWPLPPSSKRNSDMTSIFSMNSYRGGHRDDRSTKTISKLLSNIENMKLEV